MQAHWTYVGCTKEHIEQLQRHWEEQQRRLVSRLDAVPYRPAELALFVSRQDESPQWRIDSALHLPARTLAVRSADTVPEEALENIIAGLILELDRLAERPERFSVRREGLHGIAPFLEQCRREGRSDVFFAWLVPVIGSFRGHVRRELRMREGELGLPLGRIVAADVLDEVLLRAYDRFDERPPGLSLDLWLLQLIDERIEEESRVPAEESLDDQIEQPNSEPGGAMSDRWIEWATFSETVQRSELLASMPSADRWDDLDMETKQVETDRMLARLPRRQRQAMVLCTVYGFAPAEVADFQDRTENDILADIDAGRQAIESYFREEYLSDVVEEQFESPSHRGTHGGRR